MNESVPITTILIHQILALYAYAAAIRMLAQYSNVDFNHPVSQFIHRITIAPIRLFRPILPKIRGADLLSPAALALCAVAAREMHLLSFRDIDLDAGLVIYAAARGLLDLVVTVYIFAVLARVVFSWVSKLRISSFALLLINFTEPIMGPMRRSLPTLGGLDFSPILVLLALNFVQFLGHEILEFVFTPLGI